MQTNIFNDWVEETVAELDDAVSNRFLLVGWRNSKRLHRIHHLHSQNESKFNTHSGNFSMVCENVWKAEMMKWRNSKNRKPIYIGIIVSTPTIFMALYDVSSGSCSKSDANRFLVLNSAPHLLLLLLLLVLLLLFSRLYHKTWMAMKQHFDGYFRQRNSVAVC